MSVYKAINAVQAELSKEGISKDRNNQQQGYKFRGIDDVYNALSPLLARHGLCVLPRCTERTVIERASANNKALFYVTVRAEFDFVAADDGSCHTVVTYGEAMDSGDKATNKAMSAAYKYACMQAFSIPTEGDNDADAHAHEVVARKPGDQMGMDGFDESTERAGELRELALYLIDAHQNGKDMEAVKVFYAADTWDKDNPTATEEQKYVWRLLRAESKLRSMLKANSPNK